MLRAHRRTATWAALCVFVPVIGATSVATASVKHHRQAPKCVVPSLNGLSLLAAERKLLGAHCRTGIVHGTASGNLVITRALPKTGTRHPNGANVSLWVEAKAAPAPTPVTNTVTVTTPAPPATTVTVTTPAPPATTVTVTTPAPTPTPGATPSVAHVGGTLTAYGTSDDEVSVTVTGITDPATGSDEFNVPTAGTRFVAAQLEIASVGGTSVEDDANLDVDIVGSDQQTYTPSFDSAVGCSNFSYGDFAVSAASPTAVGCVLFEIPVGVSVAQVKFALNLFGTPVYFDNP